MQVITEIETKTHFGLEFEIISLLLDHNLLQLFAGEVCRIFESNHTKQNAPYKTSQAIESHKRITGSLRSEFYYEWPNHRSKNPISTNHQKLATTALGQCICPCFIMPIDWPEHLKETLNYLRLLKHRYKAVLDIIENEHSYGPFLQVHRGEPGILLSHVSDKIEKNFHTKVSVGCILHGGYAELMDDCFELTRQMLFKLSKDSLRSSGIIALLKKASSAHKNNNWLYHPTHLLLSPNSESATHLEKCL